MKIKQKQKKRSVAIIEALEPRILFSADLFGGAIDVTGADDPLANILDEAAAGLNLSNPQVVQSTATSTTEDSQPTPNADVVEPAIIGETDSGTIQSQRHELVIVDPATPDYPQLIDDIQSKAGDDRAIELVLLDTQQEGFDQISKILSGYSGLDALHLISHGNAGQIHIGNGIIDLATLDAKADQVAAWGASLNNEADLLIYGCNLTSNTQGELFVDSLAQLTGADVAASDDLTGHKNLGGDWKLEYQTGDVETEVAVNAHFQATYDNVLTLQKPALWFSTINDVTLSDASGLSSWGEDEIVQFTGPGLAFGNTTTGTFSSAFNLSTFTAGSTADLDAIHYVSQDVTIGSTAMVNLQAGDLLLSTNQDVSLGGLKVSQNDLIGFRPDVADNYSAGTFFYVLNRTNDSGQDLKDVALVESDITIGGINLFAGDILYTDLNVTDGNVEVFRATEAGSSSASGSISTLINGNNINLTASIRGLELIEKDITVGNVTLTAGTILTSIDSRDDNVGRDGIEVAPHDIFALDISQAGKATSATATMFFDGSDVGLSTTNEIPYPIALVSDYNEAPTDITLSTTALNQSSGVNAIVCTLSASDPDSNDSHSFSLTPGDGDTDNGLFSVVGNTLQANDAGALAAGSYQVRLEADDGNRGKFEKAFTITVTDDLPPSLPHDVDVTANSISEGATSGSTVGITAESGDSPVSSISYDLTDNAGGRFRIDADSGVVRVDNGTLIDFETASSHNITVRATDAAGNHSSQIFLISVVNTSPSAKDDSDNTTDNTQLNVSAGNGVLANDTDPNGFKGNAAVSAVNGTADNLNNPVSGTNGGSFILHADGSFSFDPGSDFQDLPLAKSSDTSINYTLTDGNMTDTATLTITVTGTNDVPVASDSSISTNEETAFKAKVPTASDIDGSIDPNGYALVTDVDEGALTFSADGTYSFNPGNDFDDLAPDATRNVSFTYTATDNDAGVSTPATVTITVTGTNDGPVASDATIGTNEVTILNGYVPAASDVDGTIDPNGYALVTDVTEGTLTFNNDGSYSFNPGNDFDDLAPDATRNVSFTYTATDNDTGVSTPATVTITVTGTNDAPVASDAKAGTNEETVLKGNVPAASDVDGTIDPNGYALVTDVTEGTLTFNSDGSYSFDPDSDFDDLAPDATRSVSFTYTASDNNAGISAPATVTIIVTGTNDSPVASNATVGTNEVTILNGNVPSASDVDGTIDHLGYALVTDVAEGTLTFNNDGSYSFDPGNDFDDLAADSTRNVSFTYTASDNISGVSAPATVTITVTGTNDAPVASDAKAGTNEETVLKGNVPAASDIDGTIDPNGYALVTDVTGASLVPVTVIVTVAGALTPELLSLAV